MFAPRSQHIPRTYSVYNPTTSKKNTNKENSNGSALPTKTPSRAGKQLPMGTGMRLGLGIKTEGRDRNVLSQQQAGLGKNDNASGSGGGKGKGRADEEIEPKRLFANTSSKSSLPPSKSLSSMPSIPPIHQHKTPAPSRRTYQPHNTLRTPAPAQIHFQLPEPAPTPLPSATRTRRRSRQSLSNISLTPIKAQAESHFITPAPVAWEEELSLGNIEEVGAELLDGVTEEEEDDGDVEYMPPPVEELPWSPGWDHPDLVAIFGQLSALPPMWGHTEPIIRKIPELQIEEEEIEGLTLRGDAELEEDWLRPKLKPFVAEHTKSIRFAPTISRSASQVRSVPSSSLNPRVTLSNTVPARAGATAAKSSVPRSTVRLPAREAPAGTSARAPLRPTTSGSSTSAQASAARRPLGNMPTIAGSRQAAPTARTGQSARPVPLPAARSAGLGGRSGTRTKIEAEEKTKIDDRDLELMRMLDEMMLGGGDGGDEEGFLGLDLDLNVDEELALSQSSDPAVVQVQVNGDQGLQVEIGSEVDNDSV